MNTYNSFSSSPNAFVAGLWGNRHLIWQLLKRDIAQRYQGSLMGITWSFVTPMVMLAVYTFVFSTVFNARWGGDPNESKIYFAMLLFTGMIVFGIFSEMLNRAPGLILSNVNYVKKVIFPLEILAWVNLGTVLFHSAISVLVLLIMQLIVNVSLPWTVILFPVVLFPLILISVGLSWFVSALAVYIRDIGHITGLLTTILMFMSAIFYPVSALPEGFQMFLKKNPLVIIIEQSRNVLIFGRHPDWSEFTIMLILGLIVAWSGFWWFQKSRKGFADVL